MIVRPVSLRLLATVPVLASGCASGGKQVLVSPMPGLATPSSWTGSLHSGATVAAGPLHSGATVAATPKRASWGARAIFTRS
jgi:hypothetical protein